MGDEMDEEKDQAELDDRYKKVPRCTLCGAPLESRQCKLVCTTPGCPYMMDCSDL